ncbi:MAG: iron-containing alcohol dehydrogenase [Deltaproteobacteria bacterium]|nr:iron-containing alcohol dehydrogenase [Deltaproteobacteria bacterium]
MDSFSFKLATSIRFGVGVIDELPDAVKKLKGTKPLLVADPSLRKAGLLNKLEEPLKKTGTSYALFEEVDPEPGLKLADRATEIARKNGCDCVIGAGGGSAMDIAKAAAVLLTNKGKAVDYVGLNKVEKPGVPKIMVPTTAGTGSEVTFTAVFINEKTRSKGGINADFLYPELAILDPALTASVPPSVTAYTGIDAFTHALEAFVSRAAQPFSDLWALEGIRLISGSLRRAYCQGDDLEARSDMLLGSLYGGLALATAGVGLVHAMAYPLGGLYRIPHGLANAVLLPYVMAYNLVGDLPKFATIAEAMGEDVSHGSLREAAEMACEAVCLLCADVGIPESLKDLNIPKKDIPKMAKIAMTVARPIANNPRTVTVDEVIALYEMAYEGLD